MHLSPAYLTIKQRLFCEHYIRHKCVKKAAIEAGYSKTSASAIGRETLQIPHVKTYIEKRMDEAIKEIGVTKEWRLAMLKKGVDMNFEGKADKDGCIDLTGLKGLISEMNKMAGDHAPLTSNVNVSDTNLSDAKDIAEIAEQEINEIKSF